MDIQSLGFSRSSQHFLPGESCRTVGGAVGSRILHSDFAGAAAADYPRTRFPNSSTINLEELGLRGGTTGLVTCPKCHWSEPIEIRIINKEPTD
jgi:hypothetical protein